MIGETNLMRPDQIACIREAFDRLWPVNRRFADLFYARLFELDPTARTLFRGDLEGLKTKLLSMLATIVGAADRPEIFDFGCRGFGTTSRTVRCDAGSVFGGRRSLNLELGRGARPRANPLQARSVERFLQGGSALDVERSRPRINRLGAAVSLRITGRR